MRTAGPMRDEGGGLGERFASGAEGPGPGSWREFLLFLRTNRKWWLAPIFLVLALLAIAVVAMATPALTFMYAFF